jgi:cell division septal protein FtsQ
VARRKEEIKKTEREPGRTRERTRERARPKEGEPERPREHTRERARPAESEPERPREHTRERARPKEGEPEHTRERARPKESESERARERARARTRPAPKKKRKKKNFVLNIVIVVLVLVGLYFLATSDIFAIETILVKSSGQHFTSAKVAEMSGIKKGDNLWKTRTGKAAEQLEKDPYIAEAEVSRKPPGAIEITIREREENYAIATGGGFAVLDWSGMVLRLADKAPEIPLIEGVETGAVVTGSVIEAPRALLLADAVKLLEDTEKNGLYFKRVVITDVNVKAYIYDTLSVKGRLENVTAGLDKVKLVLLDLRKQKIKRGTIIVSDSGNCIFSPEEQ